MDFKLFTHQRREEQSKEEKSGSVVTFDSPTSHSYFIRVNPNQLEIPSGQIATKQAELLSRGLVITTMAVHPKHPSVWIVTTCPLPPVNPKQEEFHLD